MKKLLEFLISSVSKLDLWVWSFVVMFFCSSARLFGGSLGGSFAGALLIIVEMLVIGLSIEVIIESLKNVKGIGTLTGFITNGPESLCLVVGLISGDVLFAASTPLGSNFVNPILLFIASVVCGVLVFAKVIKSNPKYTRICLGVTAGLAVLFYLIPQGLYAWWLIITVVVTVALFIKRPPESNGGEEEEKEEIAFDNVWTCFALAVTALIGAGYFLDPVVSFAAKSGNVPKGAVGFIVLSTLTSWPEFKSSLSLLKRGKIEAAIMNITVSNITNLWLACAGIATYLATH